MGTIIFGGTKGQCLGCGLSTLQTALAIGCLIIKLKISFILLLGIDTFNTLKALETSKGFDKLKLKLN